MAWHGSFHIRRYLDTILYNRQLVYRDGDIIVVKALVTQVLPGTWEQGNNVEGRDKGAWAPVGPCCGRFIDTWVLRYLGTYLYLVHFRNS